MDASASADDRAAAASRLRLEPHVRVRAVALPASAPAPAGHPTALLSTARGFAQVVVVGEASAGVEALARAGIGIAVEPARLPASWSSALVALRLADERRAVVRADELGALLTLAAAADADPEPHPDVATLDALAADRSAVPTLDALAEEGTVRGAAAVLGVHHSTVQSRLAALSETLGYDPRTPEGRTRYVLARTVQRLRNSQL